MVAAKPASESDHKAAGWLGAGAGSESPGPDAGGWLDNVTAAA
jgi:hypothetical protein